ncbi:hypothetical protein [Bacillus sp. AFS075034]|uniref:hypothetical protein n=1 Tax=Bacillus sp. AFS075034 TaxID=2034281 RepID=UPI00159B9730|nr:hypothetical protein [Bacillus sp. AFS075034]
MKKILALLPVLVLAGLFGFSSDKKIDEPKQSAASYEMNMSMKSEPGGGGW